MDGRRVDRLPVVHFLTPSVEVEWVRYALAGGSLFQTELFIAEVGSKPLVRANAGEEADQSLEIVGWTPDGSELLFLRLNREHSVLDLMAADPATGTTRTTVKETRDTFVIGTEHDYHADLLKLLEDGQRFIWLSERDGWNHLYLYGLDGTLIRRLTRGRCARLVISSEVSRPFVRGGP